MLEYLNNLGLLLWHINYSNSEKCFKIFQLKWDEICVTKISFKFLLKAEQKRGAMTEKFPLTAASLYQGITVEVS